MRLTERYKPLTIQAFVGLAEPKRIIGKLLADGDSHAVLLIGPPGTGKSCAAQAIARALGIEPDAPEAIFSYTYLPSRRCNLEAIDRLEGELQTIPWSSSGFRVAHIDEADQMTSAAQLALLSVLDHLPPKTLFVLTCNGTIKDGVVKTDSGALEPRFLSRLMPILFSVYGMNGPAVKLLKRVWEAESGGMPANVIILLTHSSMCCNLYV